MKSIPLFQQSDAREALKRRCRDAKISIRLIEDLVEAVAEQIGKERKRGLQDRIESLLDPGVDDSQEF
jgi:hypothetical protein